MTDFRYVTLSADDPRISVVALLDSDPTKPTGGYGGQEEVDRPRNTPIIDFTGGSPFRQDLVLIFDGFKTKQSVEPAIALLERMARPAPPVYPEPPTIKIAGAVPHPELDWLIENIAWNDNERDQASGARIRQAFTVSLVEAIDGTILISKPGSRSKGKKTSKVKRYKVKKGDTLMTIAHKLLGSKNRWRDIAKANKKNGKPRKNSRDLKVGETLKIP